MCKEKVYNLIAHSGIWFLGKFFPEYFAQKPLAATDRYIEYPFVLKNISGIRVLDVGCAGSMFPLLLQALDFDTYGIDIREYSLPTFNFVQGDISKTNFKDYFFDTVVAVSTIEHIGLSGRYGIKENVEADIKAVEEIYRILRPNGVFLMTVPFGEFYQIEKHHRIYNIESLNDLLSKFQWTFMKVKSPEADYDIALIKAIK